MKTVSQLKCSCCLDSQHTLALADECLRDCGQLLTWKNSQQRCIYPWRELHGSLTTGNKDTVCERISKEMPSQPVVPAQEHTAVGHTGARSGRCSLLRCHTKEHADDTKESLHYRVM